LEIMAFSFSVKFFAIDLLTGLSFFGPLYAFSPAKTCVLSAFSAGGCGHLYPELYAQYGLYALLKSIVIFPLTTFDASNSMYLPPAYVSFPFVSSMKGKNK